MSAQASNLISSKELYSQYKWYRESFSPLIQQACDEFFLPGFKFEMIGISKNINALVGKEFYFVTKIKIDRNYDMFLRTSDEAISIILNRVLGKSNKTFNLNKITDLEAKIITAFNDYMYNITSTLISEPPSGELHRTNFDVINLTFLLKDEEENKCGKFIIALPEALIKPENIESTGEKFSNTTFSSSTVDVKLQIGSTKFSMYDLKHLDSGDTVIFDNSETNHMTLVLNDYIKKVNLNPNLGLIEPFEDNNGGNNMGAENLWDSIEVEMTAELDSVKITLGELKAIEEGAVVDLTSIYGNKVTLLVENKPIAKGELVIINDRYGVKIDEIIASQNETPQEDSDEKTDNLDDLDDEDFDENAEPTPVNDNSQNKTDDDEFDYSDFELDDDDI